MITVANKKTIILLFLLLILALSVRLYDLNTEDAWFDEGFTLLSVSEDSISGTIDVSQEVESKPFGFYVILNLWSKLFGASIFSLRFFSVLVGIISVGLIYLLGKELFSEDVGLYSAFFLSISLFDVIYSQEARVYSFFSTLTILSILMFVKLVKKELLDKKNGENNLFDNNNTYFIWLFLTNFLLNSIHYFSWLIICCETIIFIYLFRKDIYNLKKWFFYIGLTFISSIPFVISMLENFSKINLKLVGVFSVMWGFPLFVSKLGLFLLFIMGILFVLAIYLIVKKHQIILDFYENIKKKHLVFLLIGIILYHLLIFIFVRDLYSPFFLTRFSLFCLPFLFILFGKILVDFKLKKLKAFSIVLILILALTSLAVYYNETTKEEWAGVAQLIANDSNEDVVFFDIGSATVPFSYYFDGKNQLTSLSKENKDDFDLLKNQDNFWLVLSHNRKSSEEYRDPITKDLYVETYQFKDIEVLHFIRGYRE